MPAAPAASGPFDLVVGSDLLYAPHVFPLLLETLQELCTPGQTEVLLTYPTRYTEDLFFADAEAQYGFEVGYAEEVGCNVWATRMKAVECCPRRSQGPSLYHCSVGRFI